MSIKKFLYQTVRRGLLLCLLLFSIIWHAPDCRAHIDLSHPNFVLDRKQMDSVMLVNLMLWNYSPIYSSHTMQFLPRSYFKCAHCEKGLKSLVLTHRDSGCNSLITIDNRWDRYGSMTLNAYTTSWSDSNHQKHVIGVVNEISWSEHVIHVKHLNHDEEKRSYDATYYYSGDELPDSVHVVFYRDKDTGAESWHIIKEHGFPVEVSLNGKPINRYAYKEVPISSILLPGLGPVCPLRFPVKGTCIQIITDGYQRKKTFLIFDNSSTFRVVVDSPDLGSPFASLFYVYEGISWYHNQMAYESIQGYGNFTSACLNLYPAGKGDDCYNSWRHVSIQSCSKLRVRNWSSNEVDTYDEFSVEVGQHYFVDCPGADCRDRIKRRYYWFK